jgi:hypothetical protein
MPRQQGPERLPRLLELHPAKLGQLSVETVTQGTFGPQFVEQGLGLVGDF